MDGHQYEQKCAQYLREQGYTNVTVTRGSGDQGVDITAMKDGKKHAIQCKYYEGNVGNKAIQEVYAGAAFYNCSVAMVITNSFFTKSAKELAKKLKVILVEDINAIKLMESSRTAKPKEETKLAKKAPTEEERLEKRYQDTVKRFPGNPKLDSEISQYVWRKQSEIDAIFHQYEQELSSVSSGLGILFGNSSNSYINSENPKETVEKNFLRNLQAKLKEIDHYSRKCFSSGISEPSAQQLIDLIVNASERGEDCHLGYISFNHLFDYIHTWRCIDHCLPSKLEGPDAQSVRQEITLFQQDMAQLQQEQIKELMQRIDKRESTLSTLTREINQKKDEINSYKRKIEGKQAAQKAALDPIIQQLEIIAKQIEDANEAKKRLEQERKSQPLLAFKQKSALRKEVEECNAKIDFLKEEERNYEQQKADTVDKHSKQIEKLQNAMNTAESNRQQAAVQISELQKDIREHISEKQLKQRNSELQKTQQIINELEARIKILRLNHMRMIKNRNTKFSEFDKLFESRDNRR